MTAESPQRIEPARLEEPSEAITDLVAELAAASATLGHALNPRAAANLAGLVRILNAAANLGDLRASPGNRLETLKADRAPTSNQDQQSVLDLLFVDA